MRLIVIILATFYYAEAEFAGPKLTLTKGQLSPIIVLPPTSGKHTGTVIFFPGSGWTGKQCEQKYVADVMGRRFNYPHLKVMFPTAPLQPYTLLAGKKSHVWFDRYALNTSYPEIYKSVMNVRLPIMKLIDMENHIGIPDHRIIVGGISMGGAMAFYTGFGWRHTLKGVFAISSFMYHNTFVYKFLRKSKDKKPRLLQIHGGKDKMTPLHMATQTFNNLTRLGVKGLFGLYHEGVHLPHSDPLIMVHHWIEKMLPAI